MAHHANVHLLPQVITTCQTYELIQSPTALPHPTLDFLRIWNHDYLSRAYGGDRLESFKAYYSRNSRASCLLLYPVRGFRNPAYYSTTFSHLFSDNML